MSYLVLARKYRPRQFSELVGQSHVSTTMLNAFRQNRLGQAYLFTGTRGVGKTSAARILAKALRCEDPESQVGGKNRGIPCDKCASCIEVNNGSSIDVLEIDGASNNGVDNVREIRENVKFLPSRGKVKVYIIDEVHMLSRNAFNALLKTLEEPPAHITFILATTESQKIPATILSRCQRFDFRRVPNAMLFEHLYQISQKEGIKAESDALRMIARRGEGSMRDALSTMDQALALSGKDLSVANVTAALGIVGSAFLSRILGFLFSRQYIEAAKLIHESFDAGVEMKQLAIELGEQLRNALFVKLQADAALTDLSQEERAELAKVVEKVSPETLQVSFRMLSGSLDEIIRSPFPRASLEMALLRISSLGELTSLQDILNGLSSGVVKSTPAPALQSAPPTAIAAPTAAPAPVVKTLAAGPAPNWQEFVNHAISQKMHFAFLEHATPVTPVEAWRDPQTKTIILGFRKNHMIFQKQLETKANTEALEQMLLAYLGRKYAIKVETLPEQSAPTSIVEKEEKNLAELVQNKKESFLRTDIVRNTEEIFGAQLSSFDVDKNKI